MRESALDQALALARVQAKAPGLAQAREPASVWELELGLGLAQAKALAQAPG